MQNVSLSSPRIDAAPAHELLVVEPERSRSGPRCSSISSRGEAIVARGHRRVRGEDDLRRDAAERLVGVDAFGGHALPHELERGEGAVAFVQMHDARRDAERCERADAADAEQQLLADADALVAAVEPRRQLAIFRLVALDVGIEQQQRAAADRQLPDARRRSCRCASRSSP